VEEWQAVMEENRLMEGENAEEW
jgi:hypothetical protein